MYEIMVYPGVRKARGGGFRPQITLRRDGKMVGCKVASAVFDNEAQALEAARVALRIAQTKALPVVLVEGQRKLAGAP